MYGRRCCRRTSLFTTGNKDRGKYDGKVLNIRGKYKFLAVSPKQAPFMVVSRPRYLPPRCPLHPLHSTPPTRPPSSHQPDLNIENLTLIFALSSLVAIPRPRLPL
jgi:hypothetical protein